MGKKWFAKNSKWKAALDAGLDVGLDGSENILYLGASYGNTVSHLSPLTKGIIFAVEKSDKVSVELIKNVGHLKNIAVVFEDAHDVREIKKRLYRKKMDILFQDIPSIDQVEILKKASEIVDKDCKILFSVKLLSISKKPVKETLKIVQERLENKFEILQEASLENWHKGHWFFVLKKT